MNACPYAKKYKALIAPRCNFGDPCDTCRKLWEQRIENMLTDPRNVNLTMNDVFSLRPLPSRWTTRRATTIARP